MTAERPKLVARPKDPPPPPWATDPQGLLQSAPGSVKAALTGGIASGKSAAAELLAAFGAARLDFDELCRLAVAPGAEALETARAMFGPKAVTAEGTLNRPLVAKRIFKDRAVRLEWEASVHPAAWRLMLGRLPALAGAPLVVIEVPLLFEAALAPLFNPILLSFARPETQLARLRARDGLGRWAARRRLAAQAPIMDKLRRADLILDNDGPLARLIRSCRAAYDALASPEWTPGERP
jgi:dephospho-CoA kinase